LPRMRISPASVYQSGKKPQLNLKQLGVAVVLAGASIATGLLGASITGGDQQTIHFTLKFGIAFGMAVMVVTSVSPLIEWYSDHLPPQSFGTAGVILFITGFVIQAIPSFATIFDATK